MCVCVCVHICTCVCVHVCVCMCTYVCAYIYIYNIYIYIYIYSETCLIRHSMGLEKNVGLGGCRITEG